MATARVTTLQGECPAVTVGSLLCPSPRAIPGDLLVSPVLSPPPERSTSITEGWPPCTPFPTLQPRASVLWEARLRERRCSIPSVRLVTLYAACYDYGVALAAHMLMASEPKEVVTP